MPARIESPTASLEALFDESNHNGECGFSPAIFRAEPARASRPSTRCCDAARPTFRPVPVARSAGLTDAARDASTGRSKGAAAGYPCGTRGGIRALDPASSSRAVSNRYSYGRATKESLSVAVPCPGQGRHCCGRLPSAEVRDRKRRKDRRSPQAPSAYAPARDPYLY